MEDEILVTKEIARRLRVSDQRVYEMVRKGQIPFILLGHRQIRFLKQKIDAWLENGGNKEEVKDEKH
jgi:excisionase family DNA binding protein